MLKMNSFVRTSVERAKEVENPYSVLQQYSTIQGLAVIFRHPSSIAYGDVCLEDLRSKIGDTVKRAFD